MNKAFTLIELLVVLLIIAITTGGGFITYNRSTAEKALAKDAEDLGNLLNLAKEWTIRRDISLNPGCTEFRGYAVQVISASSYGLRIVCRVAGADVSTAIPSYTYSITNNVFVAPFVSVPFYYPFGCQDNTYPDSNCAAGAPLTIKIQSLTSRCITTTINNLGVVTTGSPGVCT